MDSSKLKVVLSGVPDIPLKLIKNEILNALNGDIHAVARVKKCKDENGKAIPGKAEVELATVKGKSVL